MAADLELVLPSEATAAARCRRVISVWLHTVCGRRESCETCDDVVYAVSEAVTNCVDHAYPGRGRGSITVRATADDDPARGSAADVASALAIVRTGGGRRPAGVTVSVSDQGRWRPTPADPGDRGRGLTMIRAYVDSVEIVRGESGTTLTLWCKLECPE
ncbi:ATP-binding protein [Pseudonocardia sp.]|uniref:ATP-binding protein n=1 Tax=Pseudonocardia sp. TaxID=60912 RepID=UPI003451AC0B